MTEKIQPNDDKQIDESFIDMSQNDNDVRIEQSLKLRLTYRDDLILQPDVTDLAQWRVGKRVGEKIRWLEQAGSREWAMNNIQKRLKQTCLRKTDEPEMSNEEWEIETSDENMLLKFIPKQTYDDSAF